MDHPNIVAVRDFGELGAGLLFMATELLEGRPLDVLLDEAAPLHPTRAVRLMRQIASGLAHAHARGFLHRDVKPANVLVCETDAGEVAKVLDFGLVHTLNDANPRLTTTGAVLGSPEYMSPEQIENEALTPASDLYALGVLSYEMLAGVPPFVGPPLEVLWQQMEKVPRRLKRHGDLGELVHRLLAKKPQDRVSSADALIEALDHLEGGSTEPEEAADALIGASLGRGFRVTRRVGRRGLGLTYDGESVGDGTRVRVYVLQDDRIDATARRRVESDARLRMQIKHAGALRLLDYGRQDGLTYLVVAAPLGVPLRQLMSRGPFDGDDLIALVRSLAATLAEAHAVGVVHRDVNPDNVFVRRESGALAVELIDFPLVELCEARSRSSARTAPYLSPEQTSEAQVRPSSDVYSVGVIAYEALTGRRPFEGISPVDVLVKNVTDDPTSLIPLMRRDDVREELLDLVMRMLAKDPLGRPGSGVALLAELDEVIVETTAVTEPAGLPAASLTPVTMHAAVPAQAVPLKSKVFFFAMGALVAGVAIALLMRA